MKLIVIAAALLFSSATAVGQIQSEECLSVSYEAGFLCRQTQLISPILDIRGWHVYPLRYDYFVTYYNGRLVGHHTTVPVTAV